MPCTSRILAALRFLRRHAYSYRTRLIGITLLYALISCWGIEGLLEAAPTDTAHSTVTLRAAGTPTATRSGPNALISTSATSASATSVATVGTAFADMGDNEPNTVAAVHNNTLLQCAVCGTPKKGCLLDVPVIVISAEGSQRHLHLANEHSRYACGTRMLVSPFVNPDDEKQMLHLSGLPSGLYRSAGAFRNSAERSLQLISRAELALSLSHIRAAEMALSALRDSSAHACLILEDDADLSPLSVWQGSLSEWIRDAQLPPDWLVVGVGSTIPEPYQHLWDNLELSGQLAVRRPGYGIWGAFAILYSKRGLEALIRAAQGRREATLRANVTTQGSTSMDYSLISDTFIFNHLSPSSWVAVPPLILHNDSWGSSIQTGSRRARWGFLVSSSPARTAMQGAWCTPHLEWVGGKTCVPSSAIGADWLPSDCKCAACRRRPGRLAYVHITKTGGTLVEAAAANMGLLWGVCMFEPGHKLREFKCTERHYGGAANLPVGAKPEANDEVAQNTTPSAHFAGAAQWQVPPQLLTPDPYHGRPTFAVVRDPFSRAVSEFYDATSGYKGRDGDNLDTMNGWIQRHVYQVLRYNASCAPSGMLLDEQQQPCGKVSRASFLPQHTYLVDSTGRMRIHHLLRHEHLKSDFTSLMRCYDMPHAVLPAGLLNKSAYTLGVANLSCASIILIQRAYQRDFELLRYDDGKHRHLKEHCMFFDFDKWNSGYELQIQMHGVQQAWPPKTVECVPKWGACIVGGVPSNSCCQALECVSQNQWYSQCVPSKTKG